MKILLLCALLVFLPSASHALTCNATQMSMTDGSTCANCTCTGQYCFSTFNTYPGISPRYKGCATRKPVPLLPNGCMYINGPALGTILACQCNSGTNCNNNYSGHILYNKMPPNVTCAGSSGSCQGNYCYIDSSGYTRSATCGTGAVSAQGHFVDITKVSNQNLCLQDTLYGKESKSAIGEAGLNTLKQLPTYSYLFFT